MKGAAVDPVRRQGRGALRARAPPDGRVARTADGRGDPGARPARSSPTGSGGSRTSRSRRGSSTGAAAIVLVVSFILLGALWKTPAPAKRHATVASSASFSRDRPRPAADRRPGASRSSCSWSSRRGALRHDRSVREPRADLDLRHLLARRAGALAAVRERLAGAQPVAGDRRRRSSGCASSAAGGAPARRVPASGSAAGPAAVALFAFVALELAYYEPVQPAGARVRDRPLHRMSRCSACSRSAARPGRARRGLRDAASATSPGSRRSTSATGGSGSAGRSRASPGAEHDAGLGRVHRGDARLGRASTASAARRPGRT